MFYQKTNAEKMRILILLSSSVSVFIISYVSTALVTILPVLQKKFNIPPAESQWLLTLYFMICIILLIPCGKLYDMLDKHKLFIFAICIYAAGSVIMLFASTSSILFCGRAIQGCGAALIGAGSLTIIKIYTPQEKLLNDISVWKAVNNVGYCVGPILGGFLSEVFGWQYFLYICIFLSAITIFTLLKSIKFVPEKITEFSRKTVNCKNILFSPIEFTAFVVLAVGLSLTVIALVNISSCNFAMESTLYYLIIGLVLITIFILSELLHYSSLLSLKLLKNKIFLIGIIGTITISSTLGAGISYIFSIFSQNKLTLNLNTLEVGTFLLILNISWILGNIAASTFKRFIGIYQCIFLTFFTNSLAILLLIFCSYRPNWLLVLAAFVIIGVSSGILCPILVSICMDKTEHETAGKASSLLILTYYISDLIGMTLFSIIYFGFSRFSALNQIPKYGATYFINNETTLNKILAGNIDLINEIASKLGINYIHLHKILQNGILSGYVAALVFTLIILISGIIVISILFHYNSRN